MRFLRILSLGSILVLPQVATAQQREIFDLFGGVIRSGIAAAAQADWERLPNAEVACVDSALRQRGSSINDMVRRGVSPAEPRMAGLRNQCRDQANASSPSFDCRRARSADETAICSDPELARLDRLIGEGYRQLASQMGDGPARSVAAPLLTARRSCGADVGCIRNAQVSAIREFQRRGASIVYAEPTPAPAQQSPMPETPYVVDGLHLGGHVALGSPAYLAFRCGPSEQFSGLTWCQRQRQEMHARGPYNSSTTILHSPDGTALYVNRYLEPAFFAGNEAMDDIRRLATKYGEPHYVNAPAAANAPRTLLVSWGEVVLRPLDRGHLTELAAGHQVRAGILIDHIGNFQRSASMGLPVYQVTGGAGYVWAASWDQNGVGTLRFLTIDASRFAPNLPNASQEVASNPTTAPSNPPSTSENPNASPAATSPPASSPASQPSSTTSTTVSTPVVAAQPPQPEAPKPESLAKPVAPVQVAPATVAPSPSAKQTVVAQTDRAGTEVGARPSTPTQPRVVGPPIAIQPVAKLPETNYVQWALVAAVLILIGTVGFLLFERRKKPGAVLNPIIVPLPASTENRAVQTPTVESSGAKAVHPHESEGATLAMQEPPPLPIALTEPPSAGGTSDSRASAPAVAPRSNDLRRSSAITEHRHFGIGLIVLVVAVCALMSPSIGPGGLIPLAIAIYMLPTIIAFKVRHHYAWPLAAINIFFGFTGLGWLGIFVWALIGPRKSALDSMAHHSALGLSKAPTADPAVLMSDYDLRSGWKMPVIQAEIFSFAEDGAPVESADSIRVFFKNPVIGIWRSGASSSEAHSVRYNATTQIRCVAKIAAETKLRVGRTFGRTALTGIGAAILTGREGALGAAFLDYRFGGDEADEVVAALIVLSDYSSIVVQSEGQEFEKFCALLPSHLLSEEIASQTAEEIDRIRRMAADGPRVIEEMRAQIAETERSIASFAERAKTGQTFAERDEGRIGQSQAEEQLINERAVLNAVDRLIKLAASRERSGRRIA